MRERLAASSLDTRELSLISPEHDIRSLMVILPTESWGILRAKGYSCP